MTVDSKTRQRLLELVYGLLSQEEADELRRQIDSDEGLAEAYAQALETSQLLAEAAKLKAPSIELKRPERAMNTQADDPQPKRASANGRHAAMPQRRMANWVVGIAATLLLLLSMGSYAYHHVQLARIADEHLRMVVTGPSSIQTGVDAIYTITTMDITGDPAPAKINFALCSPDEKRLLDHNETTDENGHLRVTVRGDMALPRNAILKVSAQREGNLEEVNTRLRVDPVTYTTQLSLDKPLYQPGETVYYRSLTLSRFPLHTGERPMIVEFEILDPSGAAVAGSKNAGVTERGVGNGAFPLPGELTGGEYTLVARSLDQQFPEQRRPFFVRRYRLPRLKKELEFTRDSYTPGDKVEADFLANRAEGEAAANANLHIVASVDGQNVLTKNVKADNAGAARIEFTLPDKIQRGDGQLLVVVDDGGARETIAKTIPINLGKVEVSFFPESGDLVAELENRVYFTARDPLGEPVHIKGMVVDDRGQAVAAVETTHEGMGAFSFTPNDDTTYHLSVSSPANTDKDNQPELPAVSSSGRIVMKTRAGVFAPDEPLEFNISSTVPDIPLVIAATARGVPVGQCTLTTVEGPNAVVIELGPEVSGVVRLTAYDYTSTPPRPIAERLVFRNNGQHLSVATTGTKKKYAPGDKVELSLAVTDEGGKPVPAALGVSVVDDTLLSLADDKSPRMTTHFLLTTEIEKPEDLEDANFYLSDDPEAAVAMDMLLGTQGWRRFVDKTLKELMDEEGNERQLAKLMALGPAAGPPAMFDNLTEIREKYKGSIEAYKTSRRKTLDVLTTVCFFGGLGLVLLVALLGLLNVVSGMRLWIPALGTATCCIIVGAILISPGQLGSLGGAVAFLSFDPTPEVTSTTESSDETDGKKGKKPDEKYKNGEEQEELDMRGNPVRLDGREDDDEDRRWGDGDERFGDKRPGGERELGLDEVALDDKKLADGMNGRFAELDGKDLNQARIRGLFKELGMEMADKEGEFDRDDGYYLEKLRKATFTVRQYAHKHIPGKPGVRSDFTETLYWNPLLIADADGKATVSFELSDSVTTFTLSADAHGSRRIGSDSARVVSRIPFSLEPKLPLEVNAGDRMELPIAVVNDTNGPLPVELSLEHGELVKLDGPARRTLNLSAGSRDREYFDLEVFGQNGQCNLTFSGTAGRLADAVKRTISVVPPGFPKEVSYSGEIDGQREVAVELPEQWVPGSLQVTLAAYPSTLADLQKGMESMLREPSGCFEQASTSNYPNVLSLQYMQQHDVANPTVTRRAKDLLKKGYAKLAGYECKKKGYEWFGGDPGHEALTAYGLMEFRDMAEVHDVDPAMIRRTAEWLMQRRDGKGGFKRNARALDSFGRASEDITNAYITWALSESGQKDIDAEVEKVVQLASASKDPYLIALAAAGSINAGKDKEGRKLLEKLAKQQDDDGHLTGTDGSITRSGGRSLTVETTALAASAWLKNPTFTEQANKAVKWLIASRNGGGFGSTQATILALRALVEHSKASRKTLTKGTLFIKRDNQTIGEHAFGANRQETIEIDGLEASLTSGMNRLAVSLSGENKMPYTLDVRYRTLKPQSDPKCPIRLTTTLNKRQIAAGETLKLTARLSNTSDKGQPMTIAILGLPAGLQVRPDQLEELKKAGVLDYYETRAREVICYWRSLAAKKQVEVKLDLIAAIPGTYTGPSSRVYLYYTAEQKQWCDPLRVEISREAK